QGTPRPVIERLNTEIIKATGDASVRERLLGLGMEAGSSTPEQLGGMTRDGLAKMTKLIKGLGIKAE
ncbi:MAG: tripartite tricarboxylate transporter substrate binding protein, partial [Betaproteobacteria bacterium]|nr:tripartite tricarboxylate transporter substrate binding protein [Betaproteobacteria bacterium]